MFGMILLSCFVVVALYLSRLIPVIKNFGNLESARYSDEFRSQLPKSLRNITANYNHIFEQPTLFYATIIYIYLMGHGDMTNYILAWAYVGLRSIHTIIQLTLNLMTIHLMVDVVYQNFDYYDDNDVMNYFDHFHLMLTFQDFGYIMFLLLFELLL